MKNIKLIDGSHYKTLKFRIFESTTLIFFDWRKILVAFLSFSALWGMTGAALGGGKFSDQGNNLYKSINETLIAQGICKDIKTCYNLHQMHGEDSDDRIFINMYGQSNNELALIISSFLLKSGLRVTKGIPITLRVFEGSKEKYLGIAVMIRSSQESIKLEINK